MTQIKPILASGGVIVKCGGHEAALPLFALVHRELYNDWTFPKGKLEKGEELLECAIREVQEETGYVTRALEELGSTNYIDNQGRDKTVCYWLLEVIQGDFVANTEVDSLAWLPFEIAHGALTYHRDREILRLASAASVRSTD